MDVKRILLALVFISVANLANAATITLNAVNSGWYMIDGTNNGTATNFFSGYTSGNGYYRNWLGFDLSSVTENIISATLSVASNSSNDSGQTFSWFEIITPYSNLGTQAGTDIFEDLGTGNMLAQGIHTAGTINLFTMNALGLSSLNSASSLWAIGGLNGSANKAFGYTAGVGSGDHIQLVLETSPVPIPAAVWLFGSGILALFGFSRRKNIAVC